MLKNLGLIGKKLGMSRIYDEQGRFIPVTIIEAGPCKVIGKRTLDKNGYVALQLGFQQVPEKKVKKPVLGQFKKLGLEPYKYIKEFRVSPEVADQFEIGQKVSVDIFKPGDLVDVTGKTKGRGFTGVMKRHNFSGAKDSHGTHEYFRHGGSIGQNMTPGRTFKGLGMPGHYGNERVTVQRLKIVKVIPEENLVLVKGGIPGHKKSIVTIRYSSKAPLPALPRN